MSWGHVANDKSGAVGSGNSQTFTFANDTVVGDRVFIAITAWANSGSAPVITGVSDANNGAWHLDASTTFGDGTFSGLVALYSVLVTAQLLSSDNITVAFNASPGVGGGSYGLMEYSGTGLASAAVDVSSVNQTSAPGGSTTNNGPSTGSTGATVAANELAFTIYGDDGYSVSWSSAPTGTARINRMSDGGGDLWVGERDSGSSGSTLSGSGTLSGAAAWGMLEVVYTLSPFPIVGPAVATSFATSVTSMAVNLPSVVSGDLLIAVAEVRNSGTWTPPDANWHQIFTPVAAGGVGDFTAFYRICDGSEGGSATWIASVGTTASWQVRKVTNWHGTTVPEAATANSGGSPSTNDPPSLTPSWGAANTAWLAIMGNTAQVVSITAAPANYSGFTANAVSSGGSACNTGSAYRQLNAASDDPGSFTTGSDRWWMAATIAIRPVVIAPVTVAPAQKSISLAGGTPVPWEHIRGVAVAPTSDISAGDWTPSTGVDLFAMVDESSPDDSDYIFSATPASADVCELKMGNLGTPQGTVTLQIRAWQV
jgi:hypothetical protein